MSVRVTWDTALVDTIVRDHHVNLVFEEGRWGILWNEGLVMPELEGSSVCTWSTGCRRGRISTT